MPQLSRADLPTQHAYTLEPPIPTDGQPNLLRPPIALKSGTGILTCFPSTTHFCLALGADSPYADERCVGNLGFSASGLFTRFIATHVNIRTSDTSSNLLKSPSSAYRTLPYHARFTKLTVIHSTLFNAFRRFATASLSINLVKRASAASVIDLSPVTSSAQDDSTSELLRFL